MSGGARQGCLSSDGGDSPFAPEVGRIRAGPWGTPGSRPPRGRGARGAGAGGGAGRGRGRQGRAEALPRARGGAKGPLGLRETVGLAARGRNDRGALARDGTVSPELPEETA